MDRPRDPPNPGRGAPDWDAIAGARPRPRRRWTRVLRPAWIAARAAGLVGLLALLAGGRETTAPAETLALAFVPEIAVAPSEPAPALVEAGRFAETAAPFVRIGAGSASGGLYLEAVRLAALSGGFAVTRGAVPVSVETSLGPAEVLAATLEHADGTRRACTAFRHGAGNPLVGLVCPGEPACAPATLPEPARAVAAALGSTCPASAASELDWNPDPPRASPHRTRRDRDPKS